jgi:hypothetical protein
VPDGHSKSTVDVHVLRIESLREILVEKRDAWLMTHCGDHTRDVLPRCQSHDVGEGTTCWPAPESTDNMNTSRVGRLGLSDAEEDAIVSFMQTLTDGFMPVN